MNGCGHLLDRDRLREVLADPGHGGANQPDLGFRAPDLRDPRADRCPQQPDQDFVDDERAEQRGLFGIRRQVEQARHGGTLSSVVRPT
jgi:hypothetical protein